MKNIDNALLRVSADLGVKMLGEGTEEYLQEILEPVYRNLIFDENNEIKLVSEDAAYSFLLGALTAGLLEGKGGISTGAVEGDRYAPYQDELRAVQRNLALAELDAEYERNVGANFAAVDASRNGGTAETFPVQDGQDRGTITKSKYSMQEGADYDGGGTQQDHEGLERQEADSGRTGESRSAAEIVQGKAVYGWNRRGSFGEITPALGQTPAREWTRDGIVIPTDGSIAQVEQQTAMEYEIPSFVVSDEVWEKNEKKAPAFSVDGQIYLRKTMPEQYRGMYTIHEATHVMKQVSYRPYLDFLRETPNMLNLGTAEAQALLEQVAEHRGIDISDMDRGDIEALYDELNATVFGHIAAGKLEGLLDGLYTAFKDFDAYAAELKAIHEKFKKERTGKNGGTDDLITKESHPQEEDFFSYPDELRAVQRNLALAELDTEYETHIPVQMEETQTLEFYIGHSVGAKVHNYEVIDKMTGEIYSFAEGSKIQDAEVFAGAGVRTPLRTEVSDGLAKEFGGRPRDWQHAKGIGELTQDGEEVKRAEVHWFQAKGIGKVKFKIKRWMDE